MFVMPTWEAIPTSRIGSAHCRRVLRTGFAAAQDDITIQDAAIPSSGGFQPLLAVCHRLIILTQT